MKKIFYVLGIAAMAATLFTGCKKEDDKGKDVDNIVEDGFYVAGAATGFTGLEAKTRMANGINEADANALRNGMYEKYIVLAKGQEFYLVLKEGTTETRYSASLESVTLDLSDKVYADNPESVLRGKLEIGESAPAMKATEGGLYHIVLDLNRANDLEYAQIVVLPVPTFGVRGGHNSWGFAEMTAGAASNDGTTFTLSGQNISTGGTFKFATNNAWKVTLDKEGTVKANTNLGTDMVPGAADIKIDQAGEYTFKLTYKLAAGDIKNSFTFEPQLDKKNDFVAPTNLYMIGADFGSWGWGNEGIVECPIVPWGDPGKFIVTRYFKADNGVKFSTKNVPDDWSASFGQLETNNGDGIEWDTDGNLHVPADGLYTIYFDLSTADRSLSVSPAQVYGFGDAFGGWDEPGVAATIDGGKATVTATADGDLRAYCKNPNNWWQHEFKIDGEGNIIYRGLWTPAAGAANEGEGRNAELPAYNVTAGQKITFDFNAGTATVE